MDGFGVPVAALRDAGTSATAVSSGTRRVDLAGPVRALGAAVPGGALAQARPAAAVWATGVGAMAEGMSRHSDGSTPSAVAYARVETGASAGLRVR